MIEGSLPPNNLPIPKSVDSKREEGTDSIKNHIGVLQLIVDAYRTLEQEVELQALKKKLKRAEEDHSKISKATMDLMDMALQEGYKAEVREVIANKKKREQNSPKLYWLIRRNLSEESTDKLKEYLGVEWENSERSQGPVRLWNAMKDTQMPTPLEIPSPTNRR